MSGGSELEQFNVGPVRLSEVERSRARATVLARVSDAGARRELLEALGLDGPPPGLPSEHGTTARFREGCVCVVCVGHQERIGAWSA